MAQPPSKSLLIIAGLDPCAGAGLLADARVAELCGVRAVGVATALTEQDTRGVRDVQVCDPELVRQQLRTLLSDVEVHAVKIGMLGNEAMAEAIADSLAATAAPVVWDPVFQPSSGGISLFTGDAAAAVAALAPHVALLTPNLVEASALAGIEVTDLPQMRAAGDAIVGMGIPGVLVKGGHGAGNEAIDLLVAAEHVVELASPRIDLPGEVHGTGCALSSAIAGQLARGDDLESAVRAGKAFVTERLRSPQMPGSGMPTIV